MKSLKRKVRVMEKFTQVYMAFSESHPSFRIVRCLENQFPPFFQPIGKRELFAGKVDYFPLGYCLSAKTTTGYFFDEAGMQALKRHSRITKSLAVRIDSLIDFWQEQQLDKASPAFTSESDVAFTEEHGGPGWTANFTKLVRLGLPGLKEEIAPADDEYLDDEQSIRYEGNKSRLALFERMCLQYANHARDLSEICNDEQNKAQLMHMASVLENLTDACPATFREALQLVHLYACFSGILNLGRIDEYLGPFYRADVEEGRLEKSDATLLIHSFLDLCRQRRHFGQVSITLGGRGRLGDEDADYFASDFLAMLRARDKEQLNVAVRYFPGQGISVGELTGEAISSAVSGVCFVDDDLVLDFLKHKTGLPMHRLTGYLLLGGTDGAIPLYKADRLDFEQWVYVREIVDAARRFGQNTPLSTSG